VRLATWNVERLANRPKRDRVLASMAEIGADVWIFTESDDELVPAGIASLHCSDADEKRGASERWVSIASRYPLEPLALSGDPFRSAAARVYPTDGDPFVVFGTVLPWTSDRWRGLRGSDGFAGALGAQLGDLRRLRSGEPLVDLVWAGDFNQHLDDGGRLLVDAQQGADQARSRGTWAVCPDRGSRSGGRNLSGPLLRRPYLRRANRTLGPQFPARLADDRGARSTPERPLRRRGRYVGFSLLASA
jgi:hypothetical protein